MLLGMYRKLNRTGYEWQPSELVYVDDIDLIGNDIRTIERTTDVSLNTCKNISSKYKKTKYMEVRYHGA